MDLAEFIELTEEETHKTLAAMKTNEKGDLLNIASTLYGVNFTFWRFSLAIQQENKNIMELLTAHNNLLVEIADKLKGGK